MKVGVLSLPGVATGVSSVSGAVVSIVNAWVAGVASTLPGGVAGADVERVRALGELRGGERRRAGGERGAVDAALEASRRPRWT